MSEEVISGNRPPRCQECKTEFADELMQAAVKTGGLACPGCKHHIRVRKATPLALSLIPEADLLVHEDATGEDLAKDKSKAAEPVLFACMACGAALPVDGSNRTPKCTHCGGNNYLPDALWLRLHPAATSHAFFVTRKADAKPQVVKAESITDDLSSEKALRLLKDQSLEPAVLWRIYQLQETEYDVLEAIAKHARTPDDLLIKLTDSDIDYEVRAAVAKRSNLSVKVIEALAQDSDSDVKAALVKRPDLYKLPQHILEDVLRGMDLDDLGKAIQQTDFPEWKLFEISDNCTPEDASRILRAPNVSLRVLRRLGSNPDSRPAIKKHSLYQGLGWFKKLFFFGGS
jgi:DNA-directed RNA polymerase subunit RPC12/RpoP